MTQLPNFGIVSDTSNVTQHGIDKYLGLYIKLLRAGFAQPGLRPTSKRFPYGSYLERDSKYLLCMRRIYML